MKSVLMALFCCGAYYTQAQAYFSQAYVEHWVAEHSHKTIAGDANACDDFADNVQAALEAEEGQVWNIKGGKAEICRYLRQYNTVLAQAHSQTLIKDLNIESSGFPWLDAKVSYKEHTRVRGENTATLEFVSKNELQLSRTLSGLKIITMVAKAAS